MHERLRPLTDILPLRNPILLAALSGWSDQYGAAVATLDYLVEQWGGQPLADIDPEPFYDFTVQRPQVRLEEGQRVLDWPRNRFFVARPAGADRDVLLFAGVEPHLRWRSFLDVVVEVMQSTGATTSVTLGAQPGSVPHTRPVPVMLSASDGEFEGQFGLKVPSSRYEGPTGIVGVLNLRMRSLGWRNGSLWALLPHYLNAGPNPNAIASLVSKVDRGLRTKTPLEALDERIEQFASQVRDALERTTDAASYVRGLEEQYDSSQGAQTLEEGGELPTSEELLGDLERFLRQQREDS